MKQQRKYRECMFRGSRPSSVAADWNAHPLSQIWKIAHLQSEMSGLSVLFAVADIGMVRISRLIRVIRFMMCINPSVIFVYTPWTPVCLKPVSMFGMWSCVSIPHVCCAVPPRVKPRYTQRSCTDAVMNCSFLNQDIRVSKAAFWYQLNPSLSLAPCHYSNGDLILTWPADQTRPRLTLFHALGGAASRWMMAVAYLFFELF